MLSQTNFKGKAFSIAFYFQTLAGVQRDMDQDEGIGEEHIQNLFEENWSLLEMDEAFKEEAFKGFKKGWMKSE